MLTGLYRCSAFDFDGGVAITPDEDFFALSHEDSMECIWCIIRDCLLLQLMCISQSLHKSAQVVNSFSHVYSLGTVLGHSRMFFDDLDDVFL